MSKKTALNVDSKSTTNFNIKKQKIKNIAIYLRVSTDKQDKNTSKETQMKIINKYIEEHKIFAEKKYIYQDKYSASRIPKGTSIDDDKPFTRRGLNELLSDAKLNKFNTILVLSHDRLTRNVQESLLLTYFFKKLKVNIIYCKPGENVDTESKNMNIFFENLLNNLSALESNIIGSRTRLGNEFNIKNGFWAGGPPPYGYKLSHIQPGKRKSVLKICYPEARIVIEIFNLYIQGLSPVKIAEHIKSKYPNNKDRKWTKNSIISIVKNKDYTGIMEWNKKGGVRCPTKRKDSQVITSDKYKENIIIKDELWKQVEDIKAIQKKHPKFFSSPFLLNGYLICGICGKVMMAKNNGVNKSRVYYCIKEKEKQETCIKEKGIWETCMNAESIETIVIEKLGEHLTYILSNEANFNTFYEKYNLIFNSKKSIYQKAIAELQLQINKNENYLVECKSEINMLEDELNRTEEDLNNTNIDFIESLNELHSYLVINGNILEDKKKDLTGKITATILSKDTIKEFILQKKNLLATIENNIIDKELYRRSLCLLMYDLIDKIVLSEDAKSIEIILK